MRDRKWRYERFMIYDAAGIERHLEQMLEEGWMIERIGNWGWTYRRVEPVKGKFTVVYYPPASEFDAFPSEGQMTLWDFCKRDGWHLAASRAQMQIFYHEGENACPIETDALLQLENIHRTMKKSFFPAYGMLLLLSILQGITMWRSIWKEPAYVLSSSSTLFSGSLWPVVFVLCVKSLGEYLLWYRKALKTARDGGGFLEIHVNQGLERVAAVYILGGAVLWLIFMFQSKRLVYSLCGIFYVCALFLCMFGVKNRVKKWRLSARAGWVITILSAVLCSVVIMSGIVWLCISHNLGSGSAGTYEYMGMEFEIYEDPLPLTVEDLTGKTYEGYLCKRTEQSTFLCGQIVCGQRPRLDAPANPTLAYTITEVRVPALYEFLLKGIKREYEDWEEFDIYEEGEHLTPGDAKLWGAREAYEFGFPEVFPKEYVVCYEDRIVQIQFGWEPSKEEIRKAASVLSGKTEAAEL